jgi:hypothetical protein
MPGLFPVCPVAPADQIRHVPRLSPLFALSLAAASSALGSGDDMTRFNQVEIKPATAYIYIATVTMTIPPFSWHSGVYSSTYAARVFPIFYTERGRIWIDMPDDTLRRIARGQPVDFTGHAINDSGDGRKIVGHAVPTGASGGTISVRVFVTKRISVTYDTTYELTGVPKSKVAVTPR